MQKINKSEAGLTFIELIISIAIIGMIAVAFMPLFVMSVKTNNNSETTLDSTYLGKDAMELAYYLSRNVLYENLENELVSRGYSKDISTNTFGYEYGDKKYLNIKFSEEGNLVRVVVKIYKDKSMNQLQGQYETLYSWIGRGILSEK
ncbi:MAG: prepilin-type N-terminal cleavage/methylation domain-containing protein [Mahellales bacterium]